MKKLVLLVILIATACGGVSEKTINKGSQPGLQMYLFTDCIQSKVNGPDWVPYNHARIAFQVTRWRGSKPPEGIWIELIAPGREGYLIAYSSISATAFFEFYLDGFVNGDIRNHDKPAFLLTAGKYTVIGWEGDFSEGTPVFERKALDLDFEVVQCNN